MRIVTLAATLLLAACNTMNGLGQDMQQAGTKLSNRAEASQYGNVPPPPSEELAYPGDTYNPY